MNKYKKKFKREFLVNVTIAFDRGDIKLVDRYVDQNHRGKRATGLRELVVTALKEMYPEWNGPGKRRGYLRVPGEGLS